MVDQSVFRLKKEISPGDRTTHLSQANTALIPANAARCSGRSSLAVPLVPVDERRVERTDEAYRGMLGWVEGGKKAAYSGAMPLILVGRDRKGVIRLCE